MAYAHTPTDGEEAPMKSYVLNMQSMNVDSDADRGPSLHSVAFCFSTASIVVC